MGTVTGGRPQAEGEAPQAVSRRSAAQLTAWGSILLGVVAALWIWQHRSPFHHGMSDFQFPGEVRRSMFLRPMPGFSPDPRHGLFRFGGLPGGGGPGSGGLPYYPMLGPQLPPMPRYFANLADRAGDYTVSVRQVMGTQDQYLFVTMPVSAPRPTLTQTMLSLQITAPSMAALARVADFAAAVTAVDNTGKRLYVINVQAVSPLRSYREPPAPGGRQARNGKPGEMRLITLTAPASAATFLKRVEGQIDVKGAQPLKFRLENIPLPITNHIFGVTGAAYLNSRRLPSASVTTAFTPDGIRTVIGADTEPLRKLFPAYTLEPGLPALPIRLIFQAGLPDRFMLSLPSLPGRPARTLDCAATLTTGSDGEIDTNLSVDAPDSAVRPLRFVGRLWDDEPTALVLPADYFWDTQGRPIVLWLHLYLDMEDERELVSDPPSPFPAQDGERGAILAGQVRIERFPLRMGQIHIVMTRLDGAAKQASATSEIALNRAGEWRFTNLSPGRYAVRLTDAVPYRSPTTAVSPWAVYLRRRYGIAGPVWQNGVQEIAVRAGGYTKLRPFTVIDAGTTAQRRASSSDSG